MMKWLLTGFSLFLLAGCGPSQKEAISLAQTKILQTRPNEALSFDNMKFYPNKQVPSGSDTLTGYVCGKAVSNKLTEPNLFYVPVTLSKEGNNAGTPVFVKESENLPNSDISNKCSD